MTIQSLDAFRLAFEKPAGYMKLLTFCEQVEGGEAPDQKLLQELAIAFRELIAADTLKKGQSAFAASMDLKGRAGRKAPTAIDDKKYEAAFQSYLLEFKGVNPSQAVIDVAGIIHKDESFVWTARRKHKDSAKSFARHIFKAEKTIKSITGPINQLIERAQKKKD